MSVVAELVAKLIAAGTPADVAAMAIAEAFAAGVGVSSGGKTVDTSAERRREWDRNRKREQRHLKLPESDWIPLVATILDRDGNRCTYCGSTENLTADHVVPMTRGGSHDPSNLTACCIPCNSKKGNKFVAEWLPAASTVLHPNVRPNPPDAGSALSSSINNKIQKEEKRKDTTAKAVRRTGERLPDLWMPSAEHYREGAELNLSREAVNGMARDMRLWAKSNEHRAVARKSDWDLTFSGWMRRESKSHKGRGPPGNSFSELHRDLLNSSGGTHDSPGLAEFDGPQFDLSPNDSNR